MVRANSNHTRKPLSALFRDPFLQAAFKSAEDDGLAPETVTIDHPPVLSGGAAELIPATGRRLEMAEV